MVAAATRRPFASPSDAYAVAVSRHPGAPAVFARFAAGRLRFVAFRGLSDPLFAVRFAEALVF